MVHRCVQPSENANATRQCDAAKGKLADVVERTSHGTAATLTLSLTLDE